MSIFRPIPEQAPTEVEFLGDSDADEVHEVDALTFLGVK